MYILSEPESLRNLVSPNLAASACLDQARLPGWTRPCSSQLQPYNVEAHAALKRKDNDDDCPDDEVGNSCSCTIWKCTGKRLAVHHCSKSSQKKSTFCHKAFSFPPRLINRLFPGCKTAGFLKLVWKQEILRGCCSVAFLQQYPVFFKPTVQKKQRIQSYGF